MEASKVIIRVATFGMVWKKYGTSKKWQLLPSLQGPLHKSAKLTKVQISTWLCKLIKIDA